MTPALFEQFTIRAFEHFVEGAQRRHQRRVDMLAWQTRHLLNIEGKSVKSPIKWRRFRDEARGELPFIAPADDRELSPEEEAKQLQHRDERRDGVGVDSGVVTHMERMARKGIVRKRGAKGERLKAVANDDGPKSWLEKD